MQPPQMPPAFFNKTALKSRGWTEKMIHALLGDPDEVRSVRIPGVGSREEHRYAEMRVKRIEATPEFAAEHARGARRSAAAKRAAETKTAKILSWVESLSIVVPRIPEDELAAKAHSHALSLRGRVPEDDARTKVNYLRHVMTDYDRLLDSTFGQTGTSDAKLAIREKVFDAIAETYPELAGECDRQIARANSEYANSLFR